MVIEATNASRLGELEAVALDPRVEKVLFDHHDEAPLPTWVQPEAAVRSADGALTTTLVGILAERELRPTPLEATAFALGIHEDTGSLTYQTATQRDVDALAWCLRHGARQDLVSAYLHAPLQGAERDLLHELMRSVEPVDAAGEEVLLASVRWPEYVDGVSNLAHKVVDLTDAKALVVLVEMDDRVFAVVRSRSDSIDASALAGALGGGGHAHAASAIARGGLDEARSTVLEALGRAVREPRRAADVMSTPARSVGRDATVREAMILCQRHGQSGVFVVEEGRVAGGVSREDLDKAIGHGLAHAPVRGIMSSHVHTATEESTLAELQALVTSADDGRIAVLRGEELVGVVGRADLLRALEGVEPRPTAPTETIAAELQSIERLAPIVDAVAALGDRAPAVYLVGGTVRDVLLGEENLDVDIAVEGDAIAFARDLAQALGGRYTPHERFGTAIVSYGDRRARRRRHDPNGVLRLAWRAAHRRASRPAGGPEPARLHDQRDGRVAARGGLRPARRPAPRPARPGRTRSARPSQPLVHRRPDAHLPRHPLRGALRIPVRRAHGRTGARLHRARSRRRPLLGAPA